MSILVLKSDLIKFELDKEKMSEVLEKFYTSNDI